jgi:hypothetical protein
MSDGTEKKVIKKENVRKRITISNNIDIFK